MIFYSTTVMSSVNVNHLDPTCLLHMAGHNQRAWQSMCNCGWPGRWMLWGEYTCRIHLGSHLAPESENTQNKLINSENTQNKLISNHLMQGILTQFPITMHAFLEFECLLWLSNIYWRGEFCPIYTGEEN